ncbi:MAG: methyl-accepting chemotaxis protein [Armatimonadota bacterium]
MSWFYNLSTRAKLGIGFGACLILMIAIGAFALNRLAQMEAVSHTIVTDPLPGSIASGSFSSEMRQLRIYQFRHVLAAGKPALLKQIEKSMSESLSEVDKRLADYEATIYFEDDRQNFNQLKQSWQRYLQLHQRLVQLDRQGRGKEAEALLSGEMTNLFRGEVQPTLNKMVQWNESYAKRLAAQAERTYQQARTSILIASLVAVLVSLWFGWFIARYAKGVLSQMTERLESLRTGDLTSLQQALQAMSQGDLTVGVQSNAQPIVLDTKDEFGVLARTFNNMVEQLRAMMESYRQMQVSLRDAVAQIAQSSQFVSSTSQQLAASTEQSGQASHEIARGSEQLAQQAGEAAQAMDSLDQAIRTVQQGSEAQREAAQQAEEGMRQAAKAVEEVARSTQQMAASAQQASAIAQQGGQSVQEMLHTMRQIQEQAEASAQKVAQLDQLGEQIGHIVQTIEQIAEQTNLLALNAAIEAARAGEHGRGFAVVADEVRKLAEQAGAATKEIATLIGNVRTGVEETVRAIRTTGEMVADGFTRSEQVGSALMQIVESAQQVAGEVQSVTAVAEQMSASVQQVLATVSTVLQSAEENARAALAMASGSEQVSSAIASVASISEEAAASAEELNASSEEVAAAAQELSNMAQQLQELVSRFRYEEANSRPNLRLAA